MRILLVNAKYGGIAGGIERVSLAIANDFVARGHAVGLMSWDEETAQPHYPLDARISWYRLANMDAKSSVFRRLSLSELGRARRFVRTFRPDAILCFQPGTFLICYLAGLGLGIPVAIAERHSPRRYDFSRSSRWRPAIGLVMRLAARVFVQIESYVPLYPPGLRRRIRVIPNPVEIPADSALSRPPSDGIRRLLCVGRLDFQKNQEVLLRAFAALVPEFPDWRLVLVGDGVEEDRLRALAAALGCADRVEFIGRISNVADHYLAADIFCLPSKWEGFPNTLAEAMAYGLPCVGFAGCDGVSHLIEEGRTGILAAGNGALETLAPALRTLMADADLRRRMGAAGREAAAAYEPQRIYDQWEAELAALAR